MGQLWNAGKKETVRGRETEKCRRKVSEESETPNHSILPLCLS